MTRKLTYKWTLNDKIQSLIKENNAAVIGQGSFGYVFGLDDRCALKITTCLPTKVVLERQMHEKIKGLPEVYETIGQVGEVQYSCQPLYAFVVERLQDALKLNRREFHLPQWKEAGILWRELFDIGDQFAFQNYHDLSYLDIFNAFASEKLREQLGGALAWLTQTMPPNWTLDVSSESACRDNFMLNSNLELVLADPVFDMDSKHWEVYYNKARRNELNGSAEVGAVLTI
jgi:hypothetical protein